MWPWRNDLGSGYDTPLGHGQQLCYLLSNSNIAVVSCDPDKDHGYVCIVTLSWPWRYDLGSFSWHTPGSWTIIEWNIIQIQQNSRELWPGHWFSLCVLCDPNLGDMTLDQGHYTPLVHGQQLFKLYWNNIDIQHNIRELWPRQGLWLCVQCDLDLGDMNVGQGYDTPIGHICVKY